MKKRVIALLLSAFMIAGTLTACGSAPDAGNTAADSATEGTDENAAPTEDAEAAEGTDEAAADAAGSAAPDWKPYDDLIAQIKSSTDLNEREKLMHQAEDMLMETYAVVPLYYYNDIFLQSSDVTGIYANLFGFKYFMYADAPNTTLNINVASEPDKIDPALNSSVDGGILALNSFVGLYGYDENGKLAPELAEKTELSEDGLTYTFTLKDGLKWSDGSELNAKDFEYAWKRAADPQTAADYAYLFDTFATGEDGKIAVTASEDGKTLTAELIAPCAYFLDLCAFPTFLPVKQSEVEAQADWETNPGAWAQEAGFISNGAYTLESWTHNESMVYKKNPNFYRADEVKVEELHFMLSADDTAIFAAYNAGDLDFADTVPTDEIAALQGNPEYKTIDQLGTYYVGFNVKSALFEGKTVEQANAMRKAICLLIDRGYIVDNIAQAGQQVANTFVPAGMNDGQGGVFRENDTDYTFPDEANVGYYDPNYSEANVNEAIELLKSAGYEFDESNMLSESTPLAFTYLVNEGTGNVGIGEAIQQDLAAIGIDMTIDTREWNTFLDERKQGNFDFCREGWIADYNDPINMLEMWITESGNNDCQFGR